MRMTKKVTSIVLAVLMVVSMMSVMAVSVSALVAVTDGDTLYNAEQLQAAVQQGGTYYLGADIADGTRYMVKKNVTIHGNNHTISGSDSLTVPMNYDSEGNVTKYYGKSTDLFYFYDYGLTLTIDYATLDGTNGSTYKDCAFSTVNRKTDPYYLNLTNVTVKNFEGRNQYGALYMFGRPNVTLTNCTITGNGSDCTTFDDGASGKDIWIGSGGTLTIDGGTYGEINLNSGSSIAASGTITDAKVGTLYLDQTGSTVASATLDGTTTVGTYYVEGEIDTTKSSNVITTVEELQAACAAGGNYVLGANISLASKITITDKNFNLDLNGYSITATDALKRSTMFELRGTTAMTVKDSVGTGKIENPNTSNGNAKAIYLFNTSKFTLESGTIKSAEKVIMASAHTATTTIKGGSVIASGTGVYCAIDGGVINVSNGEVSAVNGNYAVGGKIMNISGGTITGKKYGVYISSTYSDAAANISGGTITSSTCNPVYFGSYSKAPLKVTGGTFNAPDGFKGIGFDGASQGYVTSNSSAAAKANTDNVFVIDGNYYGFGGINLYPSGSTVVLDKDVKLTNASTATIKNSVTLDLNGHTITHTGNPSAAVAAVTVTGKNTVTLKDSVGTGKVTIADIATTDYGVNAVQVNSGATLNIESGTYEVTGNHDNAVIYVKSASKTSPVVVNITGGSFEGADNGKTGGNDYLINIKDDQRAYTTINIMGGSFEGFNPQDNKAEGSNTNFVNPAYDAEVDPGTGNFVVVEDPDPLDDPMISAADAIAQDNNLFNINSDYKTGTLLGVQKKSDIADAAETSESEQENGKDIRFVAVLDTSLVKAADDYGFVVAKANQKTKYSDVNFNNLKPNMGNGEKTLSAKGTSNTVCGTSADALKYGDPAANTDYKYITCAVNGMTDDDMIVARFFVKVNGKTYYAKYAGHNAQYKGCMTKADLSPVED